MFLSVPAYLYSVVRTIFHDEVADGVQHHLLVGQVLDCHGDESHVRLDILYYLVLSFVRVHLGHGHTAIIENLSPHIILFYNGH